MTARLALITLAGLALAASGAASEPAAPASGDIEIKLSDVIVTSIREGRVVGTGRTDARGDFRLDLPAAPSAADEICLNGPSVRSAIERAGGGGEQQRAETLVELLVVIALNDRPARERRLVVPASRVRAGQQSRSADLDLCHRPFVNAGDPDRREADGALRDAGPSTPPPRNNGDGTVTYPNGAVGNGPERFRTDPPPGDVSGDGRLARRTDPRIPPPAVRSGPGGSAVARTTAVAGTVSLVRRP